MKTKSSASATGARSASCCAGAKSAGSPGSIPIGQRSAAWDELMPRAAPLIARFGRTVAAGVLGIAPERFRAFESAMDQRGIKYIGARIPKRSPEQTAQAIREAAAWEAAGRPGAVSAPAAAPAAAPVSPAAGRQVVIPPGVRITVAPPFVDRRWAPDPGYVESFRLAGIGRDVQTGEVWA